MSMKFIATIERMQRSKIDDIAKTMRDMGVHVDKVLKVTGIITGTSNAKTLQEIKIKGVASVEKAKAVHI